MLQGFLNHLKSKRYSPLTVESYEKDLRDLEKFLLQREGISEIKDADKKQLRNFIISLSLKDLSERTINRKISSIRSFFKFLLKTEEITLNPAANLQNLKLKKKVLVPYAEEEIQLLENLIITELEKNTENEFEKTRNQLIFELFYQTGIRRIELIQLKTSKIDLTNKTIRIIGKRNKERLIPITGELSMKIKNYLNIRQKSNLISNDYFFVDNKGQVLKEKFVYNLINKYLSAVTTKQKKSPHMLRHTFASHLLHNGAELNSIKEILGHSSLAATQVYTHNNIEDLKKVFNQSHPFGRKKQNENEN
ncbi:MAG: tyrosine-type recombinase/integrase [Flavobacteriaceae bacterium]|jgi:integrase/recombinase XerC|nr:tyrosine-type recombinase/integrase [Flavobacteriaceae bacterium]